MVCYQLYYYVPESHLETTKEAIFAAGAGKIGKYSHCAVEHKVKGQYRPEAGSCPYSGTQGILEKVAEYKVETICEATCITTVVAALKKSHPYECPAYGVVKLENL
jgi:hypothetical protein